MSVRGAAFGSSDLAQPRHERHFLPSPSSSAAPPPRGSAPWRPIVPVATARGTRRPHEPVGAIDRPRRRKASDPPRSMRRTQAWSERSTDHRREASTRRLGRARSERSRRPVEGARPSGELCWIGPRAERARAGGSGLGPFGGRGAVSAAREPHPSPEEPHITPNTPSTRPNKLVRHAYLST